MPVVKTLTEVVNELKNSGQAEELLNDRATQFGSGNDLRLGNTLVPERLVQENTFRETQVRQFSTLAQSGTYYSPAQMNPGGQEVGTFLAELGKIDQADQMTAQDYKTIVGLLGRNSSPEALRATLAWIDNRIQKPILDLNEKQIWDAILEAQVVRVGSNGYSETVLYHNPTGHRPPPISGGTTTNPAGWYDRTGNYDPMEDILTAFEKLSGKGYSPSRVLVGDRTLIKALSQNPRVRERTSRITVSTEGQIQAQPGRATLAQINGFMNDEGLPNIEIYPRTYRLRSNDQTNEYLYIPKGKMLILGATRNNETVDLGERGVIELENTFGYFGIGTPADRATPGRILNTEVRTLYPSGFYAEGIEIGLPVILHPNAIVVLSVTEPTAT